MKNQSLSHYTLADTLYRLGLLIHAGISTEHALLLLAEEEQDKTLKERFLAMGQQISEGITLGKAFQTAKCFPSYVTGLLEIGEQVGRTEETLFALARYYRDRDRMARQLRAALTYPAMLLLLMLVVIIILLVKVLPVFNDVYASLGNSMTGIAGALLSFGQVLNQKLPLCSAILIFFVFLFVLCSLSPRIRRLLSRPFAIIGSDRGISGKMHNAHFASALSLAMQSGLSPEEGVNLASALLQDSPKAAQRCRNCQALLASGTDLARALQETGLLPLASCRMLTLGMQAGKGDAVMEEIAERLTLEAQDTLSDTVSKVQPIMVLITSCMVGAILLCVMLPLMYIMRTIG